MIALYRRYSAARATSSFPAGFLMLSLLLTWQALLEACCVLILLSFRGHGTLLHVRLRRPPLQAAV